MNKENWKDLVEGLGILAIVASLVFVGLELRQSREIAIADIHQQKAAMAIQVQLGAVSIDDVSAVMRKLGSNEPLSERETRLVGASQNPWFQYWENTYFQYQLGLLSESSWLASRNAIRGRFRRQAFREWWERERTYWREDFASEVDRILAEVREEE